MITACILAYIAAGLVAGFFLVRSDFRDKYGCPALTLPIVVVSVAMFIWPVVIGGMAACDALQRAHWRRHGRGS